MATHYALTHPSETVLVIDLCPQANVSMALIEKENVDKLTSEGRTISFYLRQQVLFTSGTSPVDPQYYLTQVSDFNDKIPPNFQLLCGDIHLETVARSLELERSVNDNSWVSVTSSVRYFIEGDGFSKPGIINQANDKSKWVIFIDTNPSFSVYTEIALLAAQRLIIPVNADADFSREAFKSLLHSVYGIAEHELPFEFQLYENKLTFSQKARENLLRLPLIHLLIHNRATRYNLRSAQAFHQLATRSFDALQCALKSNSECFEPKPPQLLLELQQVNQYFVDLYDFHTAGIVALHLGCPLAARSKQYTLSHVPFVSGTVALNGMQIDNHLKCLENLVAKL